jgi:hypothetical protein
MEAAMNVRTSTPGPARRLPGRALAWHDAPSSALRLVAAGALLMPGMAAPQQPASGAQPANAAPPAQAESAAQAQPSAVEMEAWRKRLLVVPRPDKGCFTADYPRMEWREVACKPSTPHKLYLPQRGGVTRLDVVGGSGPDISATVTGHITLSEGSFDSVTGVTSTGAYTLQLNTAPFTTSTCSGSPAPGSCSGWEQFVYESTGSGFIQYWLLVYGPAGTLCPTPRHVGCAANSSYNDGWCPFQFTPTGSVYCVVNALHEAAPPAKPMTSLADLKLAGAAAGGGSTTDAITVTVAGSPPFGAAGSNYFPDLGSQWQEAEFNVFGDGGGSQATFNSGANLQVRTEVISGTNTGPGCHLKSWTGESTNLTLVNTAPASPSPLPAPALVFAESNPAAAGPVASCASAVSLGDTHLATFGHLLYDFQASGDFVLAETGPGFLVQTRQASGAPTWPDAAVNKAVAVQAGRNRVAICLPGRVLVNGRAARIRDGGHLSLAGGTTVLRSGNTYHVLAPSGDSIGAVLNGSYIDVSVGLGNWPSKVRGLVADAGPKLGEVAAADGAILAAPFAFEALYGHYAQSWRVDPKRSLLNACGREVKRGVPQKPFYATDLNQELAKRAQEVCQRAGVKEGPVLDACMIDVAVIGPKAAQGYVRMPAPVDVGDARTR